MPTLLAARGIAALKSRSQSRLHVFLFCVLSHGFSRKRETARSLKLRVFLADHNVAMVTYCVTKIIPTCLLMIGQLFDTMIVASTDKEW